MTVRNTNIKPEALAYFGDKVVDRFVHGGASVLAARGGGAQRVAFPGHPIRMSTQEFYVRRVTDPDARGPFTLEQLSSLAENGQVDADTLFYDAATEQWVIISQNPTLHSQLFPQKRTLAVRPKREIATLNQFSENDAALSVEDMLAAAEGRTAETKGAADPAIAQGRASMLGMYAAMAILLTMGVAFILPNIDVVLGATSDPLALLRKPLILIGVINFILGLILALGATGIYPWVRFLAMLTFGFNGALFHLSDQPQMVGASAAAAAGLYGCTIFTNIPAAVISAGVGVAGAIMLAVRFFTIAS